MHRDFSANDTGTFLHVEFHLCANATFVANRQQPNKWLVKTTFNRGCRHFDLLHQLTFIGVNRIKLEDHVMGLLWRGGVAQIAKRVHPLHGLFPLAIKPALNALGLIDNQDWARRSDQVDRLLASCLLAGAIHHILRLLAAGGFVCFLFLRLLLIAKFVDGAYRHHHDLDLGAGGEVTHLAKFG